MGRCLKFDMKRRTFIKNGILGVIGAGVMPQSILSRRDCSVTQSDILGPYWSQNHPQRTVLANSEEPGIEFLFLEL